MQLTKAVATAAIEESVGIAILGRIETFLIRRALCGIEPTGLHAVFRRLWEDLKGDYTPEAVEGKIRDRLTVTWPDDGLVARSIRTRPLYGSSVAAFVIRQHDEALGGDVPENIPWIEHVLPRNPDASWDGIFDKDQRAKQTNLWANLIPLSAQMNGELANSGYATKHPVYESDAMFKSTRQFAQSHATWNPENLEQRSEKLVEWALKRWPG